MKTLFTVEATTIGGRAGTSKSADGTLDLALGKAGEKGKTNPEALFACGYSACFGGALEAAAKELGMDVSGSEVVATVHLHKDDAKGFFISVELDVTVPNASVEDAQKLVAKADEICPYSKALRGNVDVSLNANEQPVKQAA